ncbi:GNAT family N-acetyltransferase [Nocardioides sp.]|uniref:GNAT family N-acetyltransferase n=1 Tax=Nocardioides sp. TaxID=35761 RepID=UPI0035112170
MEITSLGFRTDLALLRLGGSLLEDRGDHVAVRTPANPTYRWGNFDLLAAPPGPDDVAAVLARYDADLPDADFRTFGIDGRALDVDALAPLVAAGPRVESSAVMTATSVRLPARPNITAQYRTLATDDDWAQRVEMSVAVDAAEAGGDPGYRAFAEARAEADRAVCEAGHGAWWGAFEGDRLVASMGLLDAGGGLARFQTVETHPDHRGRGLAGTLLHRVATYGLDATDGLGAHTLVIVADPDYHALRIYESVGLAVTETQIQLEQRPR